MNYTWNAIERIYNTELEILYPSAEIKQLFLLSVEDITKYSSTQIIALKNQEVSSSEFEKINIILAQLKTGKPIQHILGYAHFYRNKFKVSEHTLIPRPETEELVHLIIQDQKEKKHASIIDIGTGSGCIPISLAIHMPQHDYWAVDIEKDALNVAKHNAKCMNTTIQFMEIDILEWDLVFPSNLKFDIIVSNPPYIRESEKNQIHRNVLGFEPHSALFVEDSTPLLFYDHISDFAKLHLNTEGHLYFEINQYLSSETANLLKKKGFKDIQIIKDINGANRIIKSTYSNLL